MQKERIAKWLAHAGVASRREVERLIEERRICLNGHVVTHPATFVSPQDDIFVDQKRVTSAKRTRLWRYHKPKGLMTTHKDPEGRPTVFAALPASSVSRPFQNRITKKPASPMQAFLFFCEML